MSQFGEADVGSNDTRNDKPYWVHESIVHIIKTLVAAPLALARHTATEPLCPHGRQLNPRPERPPTSPQKRRASVTMPVTSPDLRDLRKTRSSLVKTDGKLPQVSWFI